ncbi:unnamed protein product [Musa hybrid cultivar]
MTNSDLISTPSHSSRSNRRRSLVAEQSTTAAVAGDPSFLLEKRGSGKARGDGERTNPVAASMSSGSSGAATGGRSRNSLGIVAGSGPSGSARSKSATGVDVGSPFFAFMASSDSPRRRIVTRPIARRAAPARERGLAGSLGEASLLLRRGLWFRRVGEGRTRQSWGRNTSVPMVAIFGDELEQRIRGNDDPIYFNPLSLLFFFFFPLLLSFPILKKEKKKSRSEE